MAANRNTPEILTGGTAVGEVNIPAVNTATIVEGATNERGEVHAGVQLPGGIVTRMEPAAATRPAITQVRVQNMLRQPLHHRRGTAAGIVFDSQTGAMTPGEIFVCDSDEVLAFGKQVSRV